MIKRPNKFQRLYKRLQATILEGFVKPSNFLHVSISEKLTRLRLELANTSPESVKEVQRISQSYEDFMKYPNEIRNHMSTEHTNKYGDTADIYFILKQASAIYEAESKRLPIQVFNEMRNALDHFIRSLLIDEEDPNKEENHINKMENHIQRAFLDTAKLLCAIYDDTISKKHAAFPEKAVGLVDNGEYQKAFSQMQMLAHRKFSEAKKADYKLGGDLQLDVRKLYIEAVLQHIALYEYQEENYYKIKYALAQFAIIRGLSFSVAVAAGVVATLVAQDPQAAINIVSGFISSAAAK